MQYPIEKPTQKLLWLGLPDEICVIYIFLTISQEILCKVKGIKYWLQYKTNH